MSAEIREILPPDTALAWPAMAALRTAWSDESAFVDRVDEVQRPAGYRLSGAFAGGPGEPAAAVAGFRIQHGLAWGHYLYVDDLSTLPGARGRGHAGALLEWLLAEARSHGCDEVHLDSGVQPERWDAHRLYLNHGYAITSHHFARPA